MGNVNEQRYPMAAISTSRDFVISKCDYFVDVQLWPIEQKLNPQGWLSNFLPDEMEYAVHLLDAFLYFSEDLTKQLFWATFQGLSRRLSSGKSISMARVAWASFLDSVIVTRVTGERPSDTDSSFIFARFSRQVLGLSEAQILSPSQAAETLLRRGSGNLVFVDDFVGSGRQLKETWHRPMPINGTQISFHHLANALSDIEFFYCPLICTQYGFENGLNDCRQVCILPGHLLPPTYSAIHEQSLIWPPSLATGATTFITEASNRAGIPRNQMAGFHDLGLAVAFYHSVPDATLPLFFWKQNGWQPLIERQ